MSAQTDYTNRMDTTKMQKMGYSATAQHSNGASNMSEYTPLDGMKTLSFGAALRERRLALGYTQEDVAEKLSMDQSSVAKLEQRALPPRSRGQSKKLADLYLGTLDEILSGRIPINFPSHAIMGNGGFDASLRFSHGFIIPYLCHLHLLLCH